jgi:hypothetical protein
MTVRAPSLFFDACALSASYFIKIVFFAFLPPQICEEKTHSGQFDYNSDVITGKVSASRHLQKFGSASQLAHVARSDVNVHIVAISGHQVKRIRTAGEIRQNDLGSILIVLRRKIRAPLTSGGVSRATRQSPKEVRLDVQRKLVKLEVFAVDCHGDVGQLARAEELGEIHFLSSRRKS